MCNKYYDRIYLFCNKLVKGQEFLDFAEDCTQNTFLEAQKQISKLRTHPNIEGWLYVTARNLINNSFRNMYVKKKHEVIMNEDIACTSIELDNELEEFYNSTVDLDTLCFEVLSKIDEDEYHLYIDYYKRKMGITDLAKKYDVSATAMTTRIYRLKKKIKTIAHDYFKEK